MQEFAIAGLALDIVGAYILAAAVFLRRPERTRQEATPKYNWNAALHVSLARQTADAQVGLSLLLGGFVLQGVSALGADLQCWGGDVGVLAAAGAAAVVGARPVRARLRRRQDGRALSVQMFANKDKSGMLWWQIIRDYSDEIGDPWRPGFDSPEATARRIMGDARWNQLTKWNPPPHNVTESDWHSDWGG